ncbi:MAG: GGDEF domain-containing protein [Deltaproteobacteria bacterium]|nr:GGDEF domain-containing protein [Deltaproteobacteria bacterium]
MAVTVYQMPAQNTINPSGWIWRSTGKWVLLQLIGLLLVLNVAQAAPAPALILKDNPAYDLSEYLEIFIDPGARLAIEQVAERSDWTRTVSSRTPNLGFTRSAVWLRFSLINRAETPRDFHISFEYPVMNSVFVHLKNSRGGYDAVHAGSTVLASESVVPDRYFLFPLTIGPNETRTVYLRAQSTSGMTLPLRILSDRESSRKAIRDYSIYGALFGFLALVLIYFLGTRSFRHRQTGFWLCLYGIFFGLHTAVRGGFLRLILPDGMLPVSGIFQILFIGGLYFSGAKFFRLFLSLKDHSKFLDRVMTAFQYLSLLFVALALVQSPLVTACSLILIVVNPAFSIGLAFYFWRKGVGNAGYFAVGWVVAHCVSVYDFFRINGVLPYPPYGEWLIPLSFLVTLLFLSIALIRQNTSYHILAETDPLTKLANRRKFDEALSAEWNRCRRLRTPLSLVMADVDNFKHYNDSFGHKAGDHCLERIARALERNTRRTGDLAVRYGGEEFILLLPNTDAAGAFGIGEKIRNEISKVQENGGDPFPRKVTISMGVASAVPEEWKNPEGLLGEADRALYEAKRAGKDRIVIGGTVDIA